MAIGALPYKAKANSATPDQAQGTLLQITVTRNDASIAFQTLFDFSNRSFGNDADTDALVRAMENAILQAFYQDSGGDPNLTLDAFSISMGG